MSSLRESILSADDLTREVMDVPEWGVSIELRTPDAATRGRMVARWIAADGDQAEIAASIHTTMIVLCAYDPVTGERLFDPDSDDVMLLAQKNGAVVQRVGEAAMRLAGMTAEVVDEGKDDS